MKHDIIILLGILLIGCQSQSQQSDSESDDLLYEQYWQFQESMLFGIGDEDTASKVFLSRQKQVMQNHRAN